MRRLLLVSLAVIALAFAALLFGYSTATSDPVVRRATMRLDSLPAGAEPVRIVLISDIHVAGPDMPPARLERIVRQINGLLPDLVLIAGDLISEKRLSTRLYSMADAIRPLSGLKPRIGSFVVLGNHDHWFDAPGARTALRAAGVRLLDNEAVQAGPVALGGIDDDFTEHSDVSGTVRRILALNGPKILLSHSPDPFPDLPPTIDLMVAGHTHCGQVALPYFGPIKTMSRYGKRYACGLIREGGKTLVVTAGLGTSGIPLRLVAVPDMWLIELRR
jgi:predicted MPP superfamily phosphohydrolase